MESAVKGFGKIGDRTSSRGLILIAESDLLELVEDKTDND
jgi:hypothetical protein